MSTGEHCGAWKAETHEDRGPVDCGCGWGTLCDMSQAEPCEHCGEPVVWCETAQDWRHVAAGHTCWLHQTPRVQA